MNPIKVADGIFLRDGTYYERPSINGAPRTWRKLDGHTLRLAKESYAQRRADVSRARLGLCADPYAAPAPTQTVASLLLAYEAAGCPDSRGTRREGKQLAQDLSRLKHLREFWDRQRPETIGPPECRQYFAWRHARVHRQDAHGGRAVDLELVTLSNAFELAITLGQLKANPLEGRPSFRPRTVKHCRDYAPHTGDELHALARELFGSWRSEPLGWQLLLEAMTGCRTCELLRLRWDAANRSQAGFMEGKWLWLSRDKNGVNPFTELHPALTQTLAALRRWRLTRGYAAKSQWWIPSALAASHPGGKPVDPTALTKSLDRLSEAAIGHKVTSHGMRSFYVTMRRSQGTCDGQIAAEIGDKSGAPLIVSTYGSVPPNWAGQAELSWMPKEGGGEPAWTILPGFEQPANVVALDPTGTE